MATQGQGDPLACWDCREPTAKLAELIMQFGIAVSHAETPAVFRMEGGSLSLSLSTKLILSGGLIQLTSLLWASSLWLPSTGDRGGWPPHSGLTSSLCLPSAGATGGQPTPLRAYVDGRDLNSGLHT